MAESNVDNYLALARSASMAGNHNEAIEYYNKVLEIQPNDFTAWFGKGQAAGWLSSIASFRFGEMLVGFENAIRFSNDDIKLKKECAEQINEIVTTCYGMCRKHINEFVALPDMWSNYIVQCSEILSAYEEAHNYDESNEIIIRNIITVCEDNISGIAYSDPYDNNNSKSVFLSEDYEKLMRDMILTYGNKLKELDPNYQIPNPSAAKPSACFVVTATMGDSNNNVVNSLREFRDSVLSKSRMGSLFITWYYKEGPGIAKVVGCSIFYRMLSFVAIVLPAYIFAKIILKIKRS
ncbi:tetratricopeptide repeat protein [Serratia sp. PL7]|uniref:tetratricopeptide repeat protein n=1 Tax=Serratia sp. PL7 TaxID=2952201 RepID=UPI0021ADDEC3|nr:tetratricopeptide repeat protein [Serratia sp. PL7]